MKAVIEAVVVCQSKRYEKPVIRKVKKMSFPRDIIEVSGNCVVCRQCSSCHGCR
ncbi:hypothetical protein LCGC14_0357580 [marine sediment metagenome]|uniref:Uncharacterized protein n=1 Tax=marine sediment metagenome TaxID=412755 RepID=A0A0F9WGW4_9ZZZZ